MTLHPQTDLTIPEETVRVARAAYPCGNTLMKIRDALGTIYRDQSFVSLFPHNGRAVEAPWRLALITVLQFMEELPDRQAADAVRGRIDCTFYSPAGGIMTKLSKKPAMHAMKSFPHSSPKTHEEIVNSRDVAVSFTGYAIFVLWAQKSVRQFRDYDLWKRVAT